MVYGDTYGSKLYFRGIWREHCSSAPATLAPGPLTVERQVVIIHDVATKWDFIVVDFPPLRLYHSSWGGRATAVAGRKQKGALYAKGFEMILREHGDVIRKFGDESFYWKRIASNYALAGYRRHAFIAALKVIRYEPWLPTGYALALAALLGPNAAGVAYQIRQALYYKLVANKRFLLRAKRS